ncbi:hypothetical protein AN619_11210 [Thermotalea metallivorans]|uniref:Uncharacterized protein n=1 Tax=Thermotalea metallivorans TaxID=520762 RepID=A0A140L6I9_9FIRM|nr:hypothetical protein AN619_11210 [Thermotalea metallivorans]
MEMLLILLCVLIYFSIDTKEDLDQEPASNYIEAQQ